MEIKDIFITGTDTDIGKTITSAILAYHLNYGYWKPIQTGTNEKNNDVDIVQNLSNVEIHNPIYEHKEPLSPHLASEREGILIDINKIIRPQTSKSLIIEGAGGVLVPINEKFYILDIIKRLNIPTIIVSKNKLGTINHTLLTIEVLRSRNIEILGVIMNGDKNIDNINSIKKYGNVEILGSVPYVDNIDNNFITNSRHEKLIDNLKHKLI